MSIPLRVLIVEDSQDDAALIVRELRQGGFEPALARVETPGAMSAALEAQTWDVVISDYKMPHFSGVAALQLLQKNDIDLPFILVSGTIGEDVAVEALKAGAHDFIVKGNWGRLVPAVMREVREAEVRRQRKQAEEQLKRSNFENVQLLEESRESRTAVLNMLEDLEMSTHKLRESEERYRLLSESSLTGVYLIQDQMFRYVNPVLASIFGYEADEIIDKLGPLDLTFPEDRPLVLENIRKRIIGEVPHIQYAFRGLQKGGSVIYVEVYGARIDYRGKPAIIGTLLDITERKRAEEQLRISQTTFEGIIDSITEAIYIQDENGVFLKVNLAAEKMYGYPREYFVGRTPEFLSAPGKNNLAEIAKYVRQAFGGQGKTFEFWGLRKDGTVFPKDVSLTPGTYFGKKVVIAVARDVTQRKEAERQINLLAHTLKSIGECVSITDLNDTVLFANKAFLKTYGYNEHEILGKNINMVRSPHNPPEAVCGIHAATMTGGWHGELLNRTKDGREFPVELSTSRILDNAGEVVALVGVATDITERRLAEEKKEQAKEDLRNSLAWQEAIFEGSLDAIFVSDADSRLVSVNRAASMLSGYSKEELLRMRIPDLQDGEDLGAYVALHDRIMAGEELVTGAKLRQKGGGTIETEFNNKRVIIEGMRYMHTTARDITERKRTEQTLIRSESELRSVWNASLDAMRLTDAAGRIVRVNTSLCRLFKKEKEELVGHFFSDAYFPDKNEQMIERYCERFRTHAIVPFLETEVRLWNGEALTLEMSNTFISVSGQPELLLSAIRDTTERERSREVLRESEARYRAIMQSANDAIVTGDNVGRIVEWNRSAEQMFGYSYAEIVGQSLTRLMPERYRISHGEALQRAQSGGGEHVVGKTVELQGLRKDGSEFPMELSLAAWEFQSTRYFTGMIRNITNRRLAEESLRKLSLAVEQSGSSIVITDLKGDIEYVNPKFEQITGYSFEEVKGKNPRILKSGHTKPEEYRELWNTIVSGREWRGEFRNKKKNGEYYWELATITPMRDSKGEITNFLADKEDITHRKKLEDEVRQLAKLEGIGTLAGGIAHDFNNILGIVLAYATSIERYKNDAKKLAETVDTIVKATRRGAALVRQILTFARKTELEIGPMNLNDVVKEVMEMALETFPRIITVSKNLERDLPLLQADHSQMHQVVLNLCVNARDAMPGGGTLTVCTKKVSGLSVRRQFSNALASEYVAIEVSDTGMGISEETQKRIFEPFYTTKEKGKGTGLGLAVVFGVVTSHKGFLQVESEIDKGTIFRIFLPVSASSLPAKVDVMEETREVAGGNETLLVVEDEEMLLEILRTVLTARGYRVITATDGLEAVRLYVQHQSEIALVLTDLGLPKLTGTEEFKRIRQINPKARIIIATGYLDSEMKSELLKGGASAFLNKPYNQAEILKSVREILDAP